MAEAAAQYQKGLDRLALLPDSTERRRQKLEFLSALGAALMAAKGQAAQEAGDAYARARELWEQLGSPSQFIHVPYGQSTHLMYCGELDRAMRLDQDLLHLSYQHNDSGGVIIGHYSFGRTSMYAGEFVSSRSHLEEMLALYDPVSHRSLVQRGRFHLQPLSQAYLGIVLYCLGFPDQALAQSSAAVVAARQLAHPPSLAVIFILDTRLHLLVGDNAAADERAAQLIAVTTEQGFSSWRDQGTIYRGWVKVKNGDVAEGISLLRSGSAAHRATGAETARPYFNALLASAYEISGQIEEALAQLDDALQIIDRTGERWFEAELHRHKGQLLLRRGHSEAAEELYSKALSIAREQEAKLWELRAAMSLTRLRLDQGLLAEARDLLAPLYGWFTEGFGTPDLKEAKELLKVLEP
jgi:predicted ATPase